MKMKNLFSLIAIMMATVFSMSLSSCSSNDSEEDVTVQNYGSIDGTWYITDNKTSLIVLTFDGTGNGALVVEEYSSSRREFVITEKMLFYYVYDTSNGEIRVNDKSGNGSDTWKVLDVNTSYLKITLLGNTVIFTKYTGSSSTGGNTPTPTYDYAPSNVEGKTIRLTPVMNGVEMTKVRTTVQFTGSSSCKIRNATSGIGEKQKQTYTYTYIDGTTADLTTSYYDTVLKRTITSTYRLTFTSTTDGTFVLTDSSWKNAKDEGNFTLE